jgi:hypothetical protein
MGWATESEAMVDVCPEHGRLFDDDQWQAFLACVRARQRRLERQLRSADPFEQGGGSA